MEKCIQVMRNLIKTMVSSTLRQTNVNKTIKGLPKLREALESLAESKRTTLMVDRRLKEGKKIKRRAEEVVSPENLMTPAGQKSKQLQDKEENPPGTPLFRIPDENTWNTVPPRKEKKKINRGPPGTMTKTPATEKRSSCNKSRRQRTEVVLVKPAEGKSYADVLQKIKVGVDPSATNTVFKAIRCTRGGDVLLELQSTQNKAEFSEAVKQAVGTDAAAIRGSVPKTTLEIRDMDACMTEEDVRGAITQAGAGDELTIRITDANKVAKKALQWSINKSKKAKFKCLIHYIDADAWGIGYRIAIQRLKPPTRSLAQDAQTMSRIVDELFPTHGARESDEFIEVGEIPMISKAELKLAVNSLQNRKAPGPDGIPTEALNATMRVCLQLLLDVYNRCLKQGIFCK